MASRQIKAKKVAATRRSGNRLWLAGLGALSLTQKRAVKLYDGLVVEGRLLEQRARHSAVKFYGVAQSRLHATLQPLSQKAAAVAKQANRQVDANVSAVLARLGVSPKTTVKKPRVARKPRTARKATA